VDTEKAKKYMKMAIKLAKRAKGNTWPNPMVGALVVKKGRILGRGYHKKAGQAHAEVLAIEEARQRARGADLYVTLEPCHCQGRTGACTDLIKETGIRRVFIGSSDPNPQERGAGIDLLRSWDIEVQLGVNEEECQQMNRVYEILITRNRPYVTVKAALSLDGRLAAKSGDARWISSKISRIHAHRLRATHQALLVGSATVALDDPSLNIRHTKGRDPNVVVLDTNLNTSPKAKLFQIDRNSTVLLYCSNRAPQNKANALGQGGAVIVRSATRNNGLVLKKVLQDLFRRGIYTLLVEGGSKIIGSFLADRLIDSLDLAITGCILGSEGIPFAYWPGPERVNLAPRLDRMRVRRSGPDLRLSGELIWPGEDRC
jgi:diaminohydroxyphosphoribosylaminopyrimidine deaminase/5-amino-6-(5-phosphoribosylamino)uracil reductase